VFSFERWKDGFLLTVEGLRIFRHSSTSPCFHIARKPENPSKAKSKPVWKAMGACSVLNEDSEAVALDFPSMGSLRISYVSRILRLRFTPLGNPPEAFKLVAGADPAEMLFGAGPDTGYNLKNSKIKISPQFPRIPAVSSDEGRWCVVAGAESLEWAFRAKTMEIKADSMPTEIAMGFGRSPAEGLGLLSAYSGIRSTSMHDVAIDAARFTNSRDFARTILSLSFSGRGVIHWPVEVSGSAPVRLMELALFSPAFEVEPTQWREEALAGGEGLLGRHLRACTRLFEELEAYRSRCADAWSLEGLPMLRHSAVMYPGEAELWKIDDQYMYGDDLLIAPVLAAEGRTRRLYLPSDEWTHLWTSRHFSGGPVVVDAPPGKPAVFYRTASPFAPLFDGIRKSATRM
jgi:hypothetical protein